MQSLTKVASVQEGKPTAQDVAIKLAPGTNPKNIRVRIRQYELAHAENDALNLAKRFVHAKIGNSAAVLTRLRRHAPDEVPLSFIQELSAQTQKHISVYAADTLILVANTLTS